MTEFSDDLNNPTQNTASEIPIILLVDDNALNLQMLHQTLEGQGYRLLSATSGEGALRIAQKANPDLILLDIMMPGIDGDETCAWLKAHEATPNVVIIFLTALQATEDKVRGLSLGTAADQFDNDDKYLLHVNNCIQQHIGLEYSSFIRFHLVPVDENNVLLIECQSCPSAVFLKIGKEEEFYVRVGPGSRRLSTSEVLACMTHRKLEV